MARYAVVQKLAVAYLGQALGCRVTTKVPANLATVLPLVRVTRGPGADDGITDRPLLDVETFAATEDGMWVLAENTRDAMRALAGKAVLGRLVDTVATESGPVELDYGNPAVFRAVASYRLTLRAL